MKVEALPHCQNLVFVPLIFETFGLFHTSVQSYLKALCRKISIVTKRLSCIFFKGEADMINSRIARSIELAMVDTSLDTFLYESDYYRPPRFVIGDQRENELAHRSIRRPVSSHCNHR